MEEEGKKNCDIQKYEGMGHFVDLPYDPPCTIASHPLFPHPIRVLYGGDDRELHALGQEKLWKDTLQLFDETLSK